MKAPLYLLCFLSIAFSESRLFVLPDWSDSGCSAAPTFAPAPSAEYSLIQGLEREALISTNKLDSCRQASCLFSATQSGQFSYLMLIRQQRKDSLSCSQSAELMDAKTLRTIKTWQNLDSSSNWISSADSLLRSMSRANMTGSLSLASEPAGAMIIGLPNGPGSSPLSKLTIPVGKYPIQLKKDSYIDIIDTLNIEVGKVLEKKYIFEHTQAFKDSLAEALRKARQDSLVARAQQSPEGQLGALFMRLLNVTIQGSPTVAILPFQCDLDSHTVHRLGYHPGTMASEYGVNQVRKDKRFIVVERQQLDLILQEQALQQTGLTEGSHGIEPGKIQSVQYIIVGQVFVAQGKHRFFAKMINTQTGEIVSAATASTSATQNEDLYRTALGERASASGALFRSAVAPGWGQFYSDHPGHGSTFLALTLASTGYLVYSILNYQDKADKVNQFKDQDPSTVVNGETEQDWADRANQTVSDRNKATTQLNLAIAGVGTVWFLNMIDAYWLGNARAMEIRTQYFSVAPFAVPGNYGLNASLSF